MLTGPWVFWVVVALNLVSAAANIWLCHRWFTRLRGTVPIVMGLEVSPEMLAVVQSMRDYLAAGADDPDDLEPERLLQIAGVLDLVLQGSAIMQEHRADV